MRVAFATRDRVHVDEQLRLAPHLLVYEVDGAGSRLVGERSFDREPGARTRVRLEAITGCGVLFVSAVGPSALARLARGGVRVVTAGGTPIQELLRQLRRTLMSHDALWFELTRT